MANPATEVKRFFDSVAIAAGGSATRSIPIQGCRAMSFYIFGTLGGGTAAITFSARGMAATRAGVAPTAITTGANLVHIGMEEVQAATNANIGTTGATGVYGGVKSSALGTPQPVSGHNFDVIVTITGGTGAVIDGYSVVCY